jgi:hypothetical protein
VVNSFPIGQQYAILSDGVRDLDGSAGTTSRSRAPTASW